MGDRNTFLLRMSRRGTITLPKAVRGESDLLRVSRREDGVIELRPQATVDQSQAWFWTERWQRMEREADEDIAAGRVKRFAGLDAFIRHLESL